MTYKDILWARINSLKPTLKFKCLRRMMRGTLSELKILCREANLDAAFKIADVTTNQ